jgi:hypothetical protein
MNVSKCFNLQILEYLSNVFDKSKTTKITVETETDDKIKAPI